MAVAARLGRMRHDVVLLERGPAVGGRLAPIVVDGFSFDPVPADLTLPAAVRDFFLKTGTPVESELELRVVGTTELHFPDRTVATVPPGDPTAAGLTAAYGAEVGAQWTRFIAAAGQTWAKVRTPYVESPLRPRRLPRPAGTTTARRRIRSELPDARLRRLAEQLVLWSGSDPRRAPAALVVLPYVEESFRRWRIVGGMTALLDAVQRRAVQRKVEIRTGSDVVGIATAGGRVSGVRLADGSGLDADVVVTAIDHAAATALLRTGPTVRTPAAAAFVVLLGVTGATTTAERLLLFPADADAELDAVFGRRPRPVDDPAIEITVAPAARGQSWAVRVPAPPADRFDWAAPGVADTYADNVLARLAARGFDVRDRVVVQRSLSPAEVASTSGSRHGWATGPARTRWRPTLPANTGPIPGLFHVGDSVHPGGGVAGGLLSAAVVADLIGRS
jgi:phytoene dehydrogenase-like protein